MRLILLIAGGLLAIAGTIWALQGLNILVSSSPMTGQPFWVVAGGITALVGIGLFVAGWRRVPR